MQVCASINNLSKITFNKFWGTLAIISNIDEEIESNKTYKVSSEKIMGFLDRLFNLNEYDSTAYHSSIVYVRFSLNWKQQLKEKTLKAVPSLIDLAIFYSKFEQFDISSIEASSITNRFLNDCHIRLNDLSMLFLDEGEYSIPTEDYTLDELIQAIEEDMNVERKKDYNLSLESPFFITSRPSELKRAPFFQTLYSGDRIKELLLLSDSDLEELYPANNEKEHEMETERSEGNIIPNDPEDILDKFSDWFVKLDGNQHNYYTNNFNSDKAKFREELKKYEAEYEKEFQEKVFSFNPKQISEFIEKLNSNLYQESGLFFDFSSKISHHMPRAILGKNNYLLFLNELLSSSILPQVDFDSTAFCHALEKAGLFYSDQLVKRFISSILTKPFVILTGLSGSGKTKLAQAFVQWICQSDRQYLIVPVGADWTNREPLLGYPNSLEPGKYVKPDSGVLDLIIQAKDHTDLPHFLILDEMNLSHVERYFADFLSVMESNGEIPLFAEGTADDGVPSKLRLPFNFFIIGTVNIDETTNMFSPKVLDRANTIEFRIACDEMEEFLSSTREIKMNILNAKGMNMGSSFLLHAKMKSFATQEFVNINKILVRFFGELKKTGAEFGYRSATEIVRLINQLTVIDKSLSTNAKVDVAIVQKLLPKLHGSRRKLCPVLVTLGSFCLDSQLSIESDVFEKDDFDFNGSNVLYPLSLEKINRMYRGAIDNGFASFADS